MPGTQTGHVFISYSRKDDVVMHRVVNHLRNQGIKAWVDNEKLIPGTPVWTAEIEKAIIGAGALVVLLSPDSRKSPWVLREISYAEIYRKQMFPILIAGNEYDSIPIHFSTHQWINLLANEEAGLNLLTTTLLDHLNKLAQIDEKHQADEREAEQLKQEDLEKTRHAAEKRNATKRKAREEVERVSKQKAEEERIEAARLEADRLVKKQARTNVKGRAGSAKKVRDQITSPNVAEERLVKAKLQTREKGILEKTKQSIQNLIPVTAISGARKANIQGEIKSLLAQFSELTFESSMAIVRLFVSTYLFIDIALSVFNFSIIEGGESGREIPWYLIALQFVVALGVGCWYGFMEQKPSTPPLNDASQDTIWLKLACYLWGLVGFLCWGALTIFGFVSLILKFENLNSPTELAGLLFLLVLILAIVVGVERWEPWKNGAREYLVNL